MATTLTIMYPEGVSQQEVRSAVDAMNLPEGATATITANNTTFLQVDQGSLVEPVVQTAGSPPGDLTE